LSAALLKEGHLRKGLFAASLILCLSFASAEAATVSLSWDPNPESDIGGYLLSYGTAPSQYTSTVDVGNVTSFQFSEPDPTVRYYLAIRAYDTAGAISEYSNEVFTTPASPPLTVTNLSSNKTSPQTVGTSITFSAIASGGTTPYQFKYWVDDGTTSTIGAQWSTSSSFTWTPTASNSNYIIRVWARNAGSTADAPDSSSATLEMSYVITSAGPANQAPTVNAGPDQAITLPDSATLSGTVSDDGLPTPPGEVTLNWTRVSGPGTLTFSAPTAATTTASFSAAGTYVLRLTASDGALTQSDDMTVTVNAANQAPTVNAGADQTVTLPNTATLSGTVSDDGLPTPPGTVTLNWTRVSGPGTVTFSAPTAATTTASFSAPGTYVLRLRASDGVLSRTDRVTVTVSLPLQNL
jgi:hypothetical protein